MRDILDLRSCAAALLCGVLVSCGASPGAPGAGPTTPEPPAASSPAAVASAPAAQASSVQPSAPPAAASASARVVDRNMDDVRAVVAGNRDRFRACYDESRKKYPEIEGKFALRFVVNPDGTTKSAETDPAASQVRAEALAHWGSCAVAVVKSLKFPPSKKGMESTVNYPFDFHPKGPSPKS